MDSKVTKLALGVAGGVLLAGAIGYAVKYLMAKFTTTTTNP